MGPIGKYMININIAQYPLVRVYFGIVNYVLVQLAAEKYNFKTF